MVTTRTATCPAGRSLEADGDAAEATVAGPLTAGCERSPPDPPHAVTPASATPSATPITVERVISLSPSPG